MGNDFRPEIRTGGRHQRHARVAFIGSTGSGKTGSSIAFALKAWGRNGVVIDLEQDTASETFLGAVIDGVEFGEFERWRVAPENRNHEYIEKCLKYAVDSGKEWVVIDNTTTWWQGSNNLIDSNGGKFGKDGGMRMQSELNRSYDRMHALPLNIVHNLRTHIKWESRVASGVIAHAPDELLYSCDLALQVCQRFDGEDKPVGVELVVSKTRAHGFLKVGQFFDHVIDVVEPYNEFLATGRLTHEAVMKGIIEALVLVRKVFFPAYTDMMYADKVRAAFGKSIKEFGESENESAVLHSRLVTMKPDEIAVGLGWAKTVALADAVEPSPTVAPAPARKAVAPAKGTRGSG